MQQIIQDLRSGQTEVLKVPAPGSRAGYLVIRTHYSLVSSGTEHMLVEFGRANFLNKARRHPEQVRQVIDKIRTDGLVNTAEAVMSKLGQPVTLGYCNVGEVVDVGSGIGGFAIGDRVVSNGSHAEIVSVPKNLCARIPPGVEDETAAFTVLSSIGLQGVRLLEPTLGERIVVIGLGLIGLLTVQLLRAHGCAVLGLDLDPERLALAGKYGAETFNVSNGDVLKVAEAFSRGRGVDAVAICAATDSDELMHNAAQMCRKRGRIVLVGVVGLKLSRKDFYEKELTFQVSCSYGAGRYDPSYEEGGNDYPIGYVRWTEQRNFEAVLDLMASGRLETKSLISHRFALSEAPVAYDTLLKEKSMGILIGYPVGAEVRRSPAQTIVLNGKAPRALEGTPRFSFIGAGGFAGRFLIPAYRKAGVAFAKVADIKGVNAADATRKFGFAAATTDVQSVFEDPGTDAIAVATQHDTHAGFVVRGLEAGKAVIVEKPLGMTYEDLAAIETAYRKAAHPFVMVGFNRRFAPHVIKMRSMLDASSPKAIVITVNAGPIPANHWTQDQRTGGGRIIGEGCHFIDLARCLVGAPIMDVFGVDAGGMGAGLNLHDVVMSTLRFADGSIATISYLANGHRAYPKERIEVFQNGRILQLDNFRVLRGFGHGQFSTFKTFAQDKGHAACAKATVEVLKAGKPAPIPFDELVEVSKATIALDAIVRGRAGKA